MPSVDGRPLEILIEDWEGTEGWLGGIWRPLSLWCLTMSFFCDCYNCHKFNSLKQGFILLKFWMPEVWNQYHLAKFKALARPCSLHTLLASFSFWWLLAFFFFFWLLATSPQSSVPIFKSLYAPSYGCLFLSMSILNFLCLFLIRTLVTAFKVHLDNAG